ncbi:MAG: TolC family protein [Planctomycetota bacterium]|jgi:outer membrane protein TolC
MNRGILRITVMAVLVFMPSVGASQEKSEPNVPVSLQDYLRYAALNNAGLKAAFEQWKAAVEQVPQAQSLPDPRFNYGYYIEEVETRIGPQRQKFGIMQVFPWFGKIEARKDAAAANAKATRKQYETRKLKLFFEVKEAFYEYTYLARAIEIARENLELVKGFEEVVRIKYMATAVAHPDFIRAQVELAKIEDVLKNLEDLREPIVARLNAALNRGSFEMLPWPRKEQFVPVQIQRGKLIELLREMNPELAALDFELEAAKSKVELAKKKFYPDVGVGVDSIQTDGGEDAVILMFSLNLPIWRDSYKAAHRQAKANVRKTAQQKRQSENTLIARAERVLYDFEDSERKIKLYGDILVPKAEELLGASETAYTGGTIDFLSLVDAQRTLLEYQLRYERAETDNQQKLANLEMLAGAELPVQSNK